MSLLVLSGADRFRYPTIINHKFYADQNGYRYRFDVSPSKYVTNPYFHKLAKLSDAIADADWTFWIDDDAAFTQFDTKLENLVPEIHDPSVHVIFCKSPVNPQGGWTHISSGNFLVRNSAIGRELIARAEEALLPKARDWWDPTTFGMFTNGDQDVLVYVIETSEHIKNSTKILEYERFNTRPYHFESASEHFLVHFTHSPVRSKADQMRDFSMKFKLSPFLVNESELGPYQNYIDSTLIMSGF